MAASLLESLLGSGLKADPPQSLTKSCRLLLRSSDADAKDQPPGRSISTVCTIATDTPPEQSARHGHQHQGALGRSTSASASAIPTKRPAASSISVTSSIPKSPALGPVATQPPIVCGSSSPQTPSWSEPAQLPTPWQWTPAPASDTFVTIIISIGTQDCR